MERVIRIVSPPPNLDAFVGEMASGIRSLYGEAAYTQYLASARGHFESSIGHPRVWSFAVERDGDTAGLLFALRRNRVAQISCVHILEPFRGEGMERRLVREAVEVFRSQRLEGIVCEFIPLGDLDLDGAFVDLEFTRVDRQLMRAPAESLARQAASAPVTRPIAQGELGAVARAMVDAYGNDPGRLLHAEVRDRDSAFEFVESALDGGYGATCAEFSRCVAREGQIAAAAVGCLVASDTGFLLQIVTRPSWRGRGFASALVVECGAAMHASGARFVALGVTEANPARNLYERLGFQPLRPFQARYWWRV